MKLIDTNDEYRDLAKILSLMKYDLPGAREAALHIEFRGLHCNLIQDSLCMNDDDDDPWFGMLCQLREKCGIHGYPEVLLTALQLCSEWDMLVIEAGMVKARCVGGGY